MKLLGEFLRSMTVQTIELNAGQWRTVLWLTFDAIYTAEDQEYKQWHFDICVSNIDEDEFVVTFVLPGGRPELLEPIRDLEKSVRAAWPEDDAFVKIEIAYYAEEAATDE